MIPTIKNRNHEHHHDHLISFFSDTVRRAEVDLSRDRSHKTEFRLQIHHRPSPESIIMIIAIIMMMIMKSV